MSRYLVVAHQTARSPELPDKVKELVRDDPSAEFVVLVPRTPVEKLLTWDEGETEKVMTARVEAVREHLEGVGARVKTARVAEEDPLKAIENEFWDNRSDYEQGRRSGPLFPNVFCGKVVKHLRTLSQGCRGSEFFRLRGWRLKLRTVLRWTN